MIFVKKSCDQQEMALSRRRACVTQYVLLRIIGTCCITTAPVLDSYSQTHQTHGCTVRLACFSDANLGYFRQDSRATRMIRLPQFHCYLLNTYVHFTHCVSDAFAAAANNNSNNNNNNNNNKLVVNTFLFSQSGYLSTGRTDGRTDVSGSYRCRRCAHACAEASRAICFTRQ